MNKKILIPLSLGLSVSMAIGNTCVSLADAVGDTPYLALGADLKDTEKKKVLELLDVDQDDLKEYKTVTITNAEEHDYLDDYLSNSVIGSRALSSVLIEKEDKGEGIHVTTKNITYCTEGMYENALITAGITDADVTVAGPFNITGTAALVGVMKAYEEMTGTELSVESKDAATNELVVTGELAEKIGDSEKTEQFIAYLKEKVASGEVKSEDDMEEIVDEGCKVFEIQLTEEQEQKIFELLKKLDDLNLSTDELKEQVSGIYDKLSEMGVTSQSFFDKVIEFLNKLLERFS